MLRAITSLLVLSLGVSSVALGKEYVTTGCSKYKHPEFSFSVGDSVLEVDALWLKSALESWVAGGERFKAGETVLIGPVLLQVEEDSKRRLRLYEPDMKSMPFKYIDSVTATLKLVRRQKDVVGSLSAKPTLSFAPLHKPLLVAKGALTASDVVLARVKATGPYVGWVITDAKDPSPKDADLDAVSVYEAILQRPEIADYLALPSGYRVSLQPGRQATIYNGDAVAPISEGSFLDERRKARGF